jgi:ankyrin repeat protein
MPLKTLMEAIGRNDRAAVINTLNADHNSSINKQKKYTGSKQSDGNGQTPLTFAALCGHTQIMEELLNRRADIEAVNYHHHSPLFAAAASNKPAAVRLLLEKKADIDAPVTTDASQATALLFAAKRNHLDMARLLLEHKANLNAKDAGGNTALARASNEGHEKMVQLIQGWPLHEKREREKKEREDQQARQQHQKEERERQEHEKQPNPQPLQINTNNNVLPAFAQVMGSQKHEDLDRNLLRALAEEDEKKVAKLLDSKANVEVVDMCGYRPLHTASQKNGGEIVDVLLRANADINAATSDAIKWTPLNLAAHRGHLRIVRQLCNHTSSRVSIDKVQKDNWTALHFAVAQGNLPLIEILLNQGANIEHDQGGNGTPLFTAIKHISLFKEPPVLDRQQLENLIIEVIKLLLGRGASPNARDGAGQTPLECARRLGYTQVASTLEYYGNSGNLDELRRRTEEDQRAKQAADKEKKMTDNAHRKTERDLQGKDGGVSIHSVINFSQASIMAPSQKDPDYAALQQAKLEADAKIAMLTTQKTAAEKALAQKEAELQKLLEHQVLQPPGTPQAPSPPAVINIHIPNPSLSPRRPSSTSAGRHVSTPMPDPSKRNHSHDLPVSNVGAKTLTSDEDSTPASGQKVAAQHLALPTPSAPTPVTGSSDSTSPPSIQVTGSGNTIILGAAPSPASASGTQAGSKRNDDQRNHPGQQPSAATLFHARPSSPSSSQRHRQTADKAGATAAGKSLNTKAGDLRPNASTGGVAAAAAVTAGVDIRIGAAEEKIDSGGGAIIQEHHTNCCSKITCVLL